MRRATSYLINDELLIDAGSVAEGLPLEAQASLGPILISHAHLDHIKDLAFLCDNCLSIRKGPFEVYCNSYVRQAVLNHLFNDVIWPDFSKIPSPENPIIRFHTHHIRAIFFMGPLSNNAGRSQSPWTVLGVYDQK